MWWKKNNMVKDATGRHVKQCYDEDKEFYEKFEKIIVVLCKEYICYIKFNGARFSHKDGKKKYLADDKIRLCEFIRDKFCPKYYMWGLEYTLCKWRQYINFVLKILLYRYGRNVFIGDFVSNKNFNNWLVSKEKEIAGFSYNREQF